MLFHIEAKICKEKEDIEMLQLLYKEGETGDRIPSAKGVTYETLWNEKYQYEKPGIDEEGIIAVAFISSYKRGLPISDRKWIKFNEMFFKDLCGTENVLSVLYKRSETAPYCVTFVFPQQGRVLSTQGWIHNEKIEKKVKDKFYLRIEEYIGVFHDEEQEKRKAEEKEKRKHYPMLNASEHYEMEERDKRDDTVMIYDTISREKYVQTDMPYEDLKKIQDSTLTYFTEGVERRMFKEAQKGEITPQQFLKHVENYLQRNWKELSQNDRNYIKDKVYSAVYQYYVLEPLIDDESISDIKVMDYDKIRVKIGGHRYTSNLHFLSKQDYLRFLEGVAIRNHLNFSTRPQCIFSDISSSNSFRMRFDITTEIVNSVDHPYFHIRKIPKKKRTIADLIDLDMMPIYVADYLIDKVKNSSGMLFCGKGASGKTTILSTLLDYIPFDMAGVVIQESEELFSDIHPELEFQHVLLAEQSPTGEEIGLKELTRAALVSDEDYIVIGEMKGGECLYAINAAATGHKFMGTIHSPDSQSAIDKMADYIMYESKYDKEQAEYMLKDIQVIVFMQNFKVEEISEVVGWDNEKKKLIYKLVYVRDPEKYMKEKERKLTA